jgi:hypothetical protein
MLHKISEMCDKVSVIYGKSLKLRELKYDENSKASKHEIDELVSDIQSLCREIANDTSKYVKR